MSQEPVLSVLFLWHQHQPYYKDLLSNRYELPWVRLHATKDYYDMVALLDEYPRIKANFNLVPSLLVQLDDYAEGHFHDRFHALTVKPANDLSFEDKLFLLQNFFMANWDRMIDPNPRYRELLDKRGRITGMEDYPRIQQYFKEQDWRDLQVWFNLSWFDPYWRQHDEGIAKLFAKGKNFTEEDKLMMTAAQQRICGSVVAKHKELADRGQIEVSASPFYHPILPLLCDTQAARMAMPNVRLPQERFQQPEDARMQIRKAIEDHERRFGRKPQGMWPSEGSVSEQAATLLMEEGLRWVATDEAVLALSVTPQPFERDQLYEPYRLEINGKSLNFFFRDHELSDAIGFVYTSWDSHAAARDFVGRLHAIRKRLLEKDPSRAHVVPVILDGENCWEYYPEDGQVFLRELYRLLSADPLLETVTASDYLDRHPPRSTLPRLWSGSWINANFGIWIGHGEDNKAWDLLTKTRRFLIEREQIQPELKGTPQHRLAWEEIFIAEGSDWCWWYGDDHSSANDETFDYLFRKHLMNVYTLLGTKVPEELHIAIKQRGRQSQITPPIDFVTPRIDGKITSYFEWNAAGVYQTEAGATGTMHRAQNVIKTVYFGFDLQKLYFRFDLSKSVADISAEDLTYKIIFISPESTEIELRLNKGTPGIAQYVLHRKAKNEIHPFTAEFAAANKVIEFAIPLTALQMPPTANIAWYVVIDRDGAEQERWPTDRPISFAYPNDESFANAWTL